MKVLIYHLLKTSFLGLPFLLLDVKVLIEYWMFIDSSISLSLRDTATTIRFLEDLDQLSLGHGRVTRRLGPSASALLLSLLRQTSNLNNHEHLPLTYRNSA